jgi:glycerophosphoryl diester phosphodiesterase
VRALGLALLLAGLAATPALTQPVCGATPVMDGLQAQLERPRGDLLIAAHRAGHLNAPENALAAIEEAVVEGADLIEIDIKVSADGVPYLMHDQTVTRTTGGKGDAERLTYAQVRALTLKGGTEPPPTLLEALRRSCGRVLVDLDLKTERVAPIVAVVEGLGMLDQVIFFDGDSNVLRQVRKLAPTARVMPRVAERDALRDKAADLAPVAIIHGDPDSLVPALQAGIRALPARTWINALGEVDEAIEADAPDVCARLGALVDLDANVIQTDQPRRLRKALVACGLKAAP